MLKHITLKNFKRFEDVNVALRDFVVLMGENGSGKTSLLQAIALGVRLFGSTDLLTYDVGTGRITPRRKAIPYTQLPGLYVDDLSDVFYGKLTRSQRGTRPMRVELTDANDNIYRLEITQNFGAYTAKSVSVQADFPATPLLFSHPPLFISGFVGIQSSEERFFPLAIQDRLTRGRASEVLRNLLYELSLKDPAKFDRLKKVIKDNFNFEIGDVNFNEENDINIHANYREELGRRRLEFDLSNAGSGFLQILQILVPIYHYSPKSNIILLDEPDAHLHPNLQRTIARVLQEIARDENLQIIVSTHSTAIIREVVPQAVIPVSSDKTTLASLGSTDDVEGEIASRLDNYTAGKASISGKIVFVEDKDRSVLEKIDILGELGLFEGPHTVPVMSSQGKDDKIPFRIKPALEEVAGTEIDIHFIRDGDGLPPEWREKLEAYAVKSSVNLILLPRHEIESYLIHPPLIVRAMDQLGVQVSEQEVTDLLVAVMLDVVARSKYGFERLLRDGLYKAGRLVNEDYTHPQAEGEALKIRTEYEKLTAFEDLVIIAPGKETLKEFHQRVRAVWNVQLTNARLLRSLEGMDIDAALLAKLKGISRDD